MDVNVIFYIYTRQIIECKERDIARDQMKGMVGQHDVITNNE